jgi:beta-glucanase (GH16 family)
MLMFERLMPSGRPTQTSRGFRNPVRWCVRLLFALGACPAVFADTDPPTVSVSATAFRESSAGVSVAADHVDLAAGGQWFAFDVEIPVAGRYRTEVTAKAASDAPVTIHLEDAIDNQDGRHYDITAAMSVVGAEFRAVHKDGSPLNAGRHRMKLHAEGGASAVATIRFVLLKPHEVTPTVLEQPLEGAAWKLAWADEFETPGQPDPMIWAHDIGNWGWGNNEPQYYTDGRLENARVEDGRLIVEARRDRGDGGWSSARLTTRGRMSFLYGRIEFRAKTTTGRGSWAAIWMLGDSYRDEISWPYCGEIDILENVGREIDDATGDGLAHFSCHTRAFYFKQNNHISTTKQVPQLGNRFHDYALEWTPEAVKIFFDGEHVYTYDKQGSDLEYPFRQPQNLIINMAMGGGMGGEIDPALTSERLEVEYIRVYGRPE